MTDVERMKRYSVTIDGFHDGPANFIAASKSKAVFKCYRALTDAGYKMSFREFLGRIYVLHYGHVPLTTEPER